MGIPGLLPLLKKASKNSHVRQLSGCTAAIDAYCWLHKGAFGCAEKLGKGEPTDAYITYCLKYINVLLENNVKPILVLDGRNLPSKAHTEKKRRQKRDENKKLARKYLQEGKRKEAWECFTKCVDITPAMAREFIKVLRERKIDYVVAPYEADAQLANLARTGIADVVITEDSDLVLFGCPKIFFKMSVNGDGVLFDQTKLPQCLGLTPKKFEFDRFRWMCIMSGCDYLASIPGIGLGRAKTVMLASTETDIRKIILSIPTILTKLQIEVPDEYIDGFIQAENTFLYQLVFDTKSRKVVPLTAYPDNIDQEILTYCGTYEDTQLAVNMALGNVDIHTLKTVDTYEPLRSGYTNRSIWSQSYNPQNKTVAPASHSVTVGMQISVASSQKKKRPLTVTNMDLDNNVLGDKDLLSMYAERTETKIEISINSDDEESHSHSLPTQSPLNAKRRRMTEEKDSERINGSPSGNTRSKNRASKSPFVKSPDCSETRRVFVRSKYFRRDEKTTIKLCEESEDDVESRTQKDSGFEQMDDSNTPQLSIYSNSETFSCEIDSSQHLSQLSDTSCGAYNGDVSVKKTFISAKKTEEITLDDNDAETVNSPLVSEVFRLTQASLKSLKVNSPPQASTNAFNKSISSSKISTKQPQSCRRQGLSRSARKIDPKQQNLRDMFSRQQK